MPRFVIAAIIGLACLAAFEASRNWRRGKLLARLREDWGRVRRITAPLDDRTNEAWRELQDPANTDAAIDDRTWADLDLDAILAAIDRTQTALGRQLLYWRLRSGAAWKDAASLEALTVRLGADPELRETIGVHLAGGGESLGIGLWVITRPDLILVRWWYWGFPLLSLAMLASLITIPFAPRALLAVFALVVVNLVVRMATAWQIPGLLAPMRQMGPLIWTAEGLAPRVKDLFPELVDDLAAVKPLRGIATWVSRDANTSGDIAAAVWDYLNLLFVLDANALLFSARLLRRLGPVLSRVAVRVGEVDSALSVASLRAEPRDWTVPVWSDAETTRAGGIWHPLVETPVVNDAELLPGTGVVITGANMSGKSTYLRAVGIAAVLARGINTCPASSWRGQTFRVRSLIGRNDDLAAGKSYYQVEADGVVQLLGDSRQHTRTLFLLDELLRGTNTIERLAAGEAVLRALLDGHQRPSPHVVMVATHDGELVSMLHGLYIPFHFRESVGPDGLLFDYQRREGPATTRTAIALLKATGAPESVIQAATSRAQQLDENAAAARLLPRAVQ